MKEDHLFKNLLQTYERVQAKEAIVTAVYDPSKHMLNAFLKNLVKRNCVLKKTSADCFFFDRKTYLHSHSFANTGETAPILHGSLRKEFRHYLTQFDEVNAEQENVGNYLNKMLLAVKSIEELQERIPEPLWPKVDFIKPRHFSNEMGNEWVINEDSAKKYLNIMKTRLTYNLLEFAA